MMTESDYSVKTKSNITDINTATTTWSNHIENKTHIFQENRLYESDEYKQPIQLNQIKTALSLLCNN